MANQAEPGTVGRVGTESASAEMAAAHGASAVHPGENPQSGVAMTIAAHSTPYPPYHGRKVSWVAVSLVMVGFLVGGFAMVLRAGGPIWWLFWTGAGLSALGLLVSVAINIFEDWY